MTEPSHDSMSRASDTSVGFAIASLVLGLLSLPLGLFLIGGLFGLVGLILGWMQLARRSAGRGMAWAGVILSVCGILVSGGLGYLYYGAFKALRENMGRQGRAANLDRWEGVIAPDLTLTNLQGEVISLKDLRGKRVVLDFWATWCPPCRKEIPHFVQLAAETPTDQLAIVGVSSEPGKKLEPFVKEQNIGYSIASADDLPMPYGDISSIPTTFFIDRKGVITKILVGYHDYEALKGEALAPDFSGTPLEKPRAPTSGLRPSSQLLKPVVRWSTEIPGTTACCAGDWNNDGASEVLLENAGGMLEVLNPEGRRIAQVKLPSTFMTIECGRKEGGARLLGYSIWAREVQVLGDKGDALWSYGAGNGVDGAHWGDLDGDGTDEMVVGMNGKGGLHGVSSDGHMLWKYDAIANVWNQSVIPAAPGCPARVFATEAGGGICEFDGGGRFLKKIRPAGLYCTPVAAARMDATGTVQIVTAAEGEVLAMAEDGSVTWKTSSWDDSPTSSGDVDGDGTREWAIREASGDVVIASAAGEKMAAIPDPGVLNHFLLVPQAGGKSLLVLVKPEKVEAYAFE